MDDMKEGSGHASKSVDETARQKLLDLERKAKRRKVKQIRVQKIKAAMRYQVFERMWKLMLLDSNKVVRCMKFLFVVRIWPCSLTLNVFRYLWFDSNLDTEGRCLIIWTTGLASEDRNCLSVTHVAMHIASTVDKNNFRIRYEDMRSWVSHATCSRK